MKTPAPGGGAGVIIRPGWGLGVEGGAQTLCITATFATMFHRKIKISFADFISWKNPARELLSGVRVPVQEIALYSVCVFVIPPA